MISCPCCCCCARFNKKAVKQVKPPLASLLTLHPHHFPEELFGDRDKR
jgi:hypothetical protein